jgi:hypothetical protein
MTIDERGKTRAVYGSWDAARASKSLRRLVADWLLLAVRRSELILRMVCFLAEETRVKYDLFAGIVAQAKMVVCLRDD